jgi:hypothetical protein
MKNAVLLTEDEYLLTMRQRVDALKARGNPTQPKTLPAINAFLRVIIRIADDYPNQRPTPDEIVKMLGMAGSSRQV